MRSLLSVPTRISNSQRSLVIVSPAAELRVPAIYEWREFAEAGGLMSHGTSLPRGHIAKPATSSPASPRRRKPRRPAGARKPASSNSSVNLKTAKRSISPRASRVRPR